MTHRRVKHDLELWIIARSTSGVRHPDGRPGCWIAFEDGTSIIIIEGAPSPRCLWCDQATTAADIYVFLFADTAS